MEKLAVYGTLKRGGFWHKIIENSQARYVKNDYIEISSLRNVISQDVGDAGKQYPHVVFAPGTGRCLFVEIYELSFGDILKYIDPLEECTGEANDPYGRKKVQTLSGEIVWAYDSHWEAGKDIENFFEREEKNTRYYNWVDHNFIGK